MAIRFRQGVRSMKKNYHFAEHIYKLLTAVLLAFVISFYLTLFLGTNVLICAVVSVQTTVGILIYLYLHWGYNMSPGDRSSYSEFLIGMLPAQAIHFSIYAVLYFLFVKVCEYKIFESLPIHRVAVNTPRSRCWISQSEWTKTQQSFFQSICFPYFCAYFSFFF